jgi:uncharacterized DUF497 family protein
VEIEFDPDKDAANLAKHGISLARAVEMVILEVQVDRRFDYGEPRYRAWGYIEQTAYFLGFTVRGRKIRAITLRRAHQREMNRYVPEEIRRLHFGRTKGNGV